MYYKSSLKHNHIFLYFIDNLMFVKFGDLCLPATLTCTRDLYPHLHPHPRHLDILVNVIYRSRRRKQKFALLKNLKRPDVTSKQSTYAKRNLHIQTGFVSLFQAFRQQSAGVSGERVKLYTRKTGGGARGARVRVLPPTRLQSPLVFLFFVNFSPALYYLNAWNTLCIRSLELEFRVKRQLSVTYHS